jgi:hyperosmotically inducible protein
MGSMTGLRALAVPFVLATSVAVAAQTGAKQEAREQKQDAKTAAASSGNALKDSWITMKVHSQFVPEATLDDSDIDVDTKAGVVTLTGTVASEAGRGRAVALAKGTDGVKSVNDKLRVVASRDASAEARNAGAKAGAATRETGRDAAAKTRETGRTAAEAAREGKSDAKAAAKQGGGNAGRAVTDGWIKSKIAAQFVTENSLDNSDIDIDVTKGSVVLNGAVRTAAAKERATALATATDGVKAVKNNLKVDVNAK